MFVVDFFVFFLEVTCGSNSFKCAESYFLSFLIIVIYHLKALLMSS